MAAIKGLQQALNQLRNLRADSENLARQVLEEETSIILAEAKSAAPIDTGDLVNSGGKEVAANGISGTVYFEAKHAPYVEFGTGPLTQVPVGYEDYAYTNFFVNGEGNSTPRPFLFPAGLKAEPRLLEKLEVAFQKLNK